MSLAVVSGKADFDFTDKFKKTSIKYNLPFSIPAPETAFFRIWAGFGQSIPSLTYNPLIAILSH